MKFSYLIAFTGVVFTLFGESSGIVPLFWLGIGVTLWGAIRLWRSGGKKNEANKKETNQS